MANVIHLDQPNQLPLVFLDRLAEFDIKFRVVEWIAQLEYSDRFARLLSDISKYLYTKHIAVYHCTKELNHGYYETNGLRILNLQTHISEFLDLIKHKTDADLYKQFLDGLQQWQGENNQAGNRENMVWFVFTPQLVNQSGTRCFFKYYGGEAIYWPFIEDSQSREAQFLEKMGHPVVIEAALPPADFKVFKEHVFAREIVGAYIKSINSEFHWEHFEGYLERSVLPHEITAVHTHDAFLSKL